MSRRGNCWDNAPQESYFGHMKDELNLDTVNVNIKMYKKGKISMYKKRNIICSVSRHLNAPIYL